MENDSYLEEVFPFFGSLGDFFDYDFGLPHLGCDHGQVALTHVVARVQEREHRRYDRHKLLKQIGNRK